MSEDSKTTEEMPSGEWVMPEPVFRTTDGQTPVNLHNTEIQDEPGFSNAVTAETEVLPPPGEESVEPGFRDAPTIETKGPAKDPEPVKVKAAAAKPAKKGGCAKSFFSTVLVIAIAVIAIVGALVYYFFYYHPADTVTF